MSKSLKGVSSIEEFELEGKNLFMRLDLNVPIKNGLIQDCTRIDAALPSIRYALEKGARLVVASHLGRPKGKPDPQLSLQPVAEMLGEKLNVEVAFIEAPNSDATKALLKTLLPGQILVLENLRFNEGETKNSEDLARHWAEFTEVYINDAFGASHRAHASTQALPSLVKAKGVGFLIQKEVKVLDKVLNEAESPFCAIMGGAKVSDKMGLIENLLDRVDTFLIGGAMAYTFLKAKGFNVGKSLVENDKLKYAAELLARVESRNKDILLPVDHVVSHSLADVESMQITSDENIPDAYLAVDIGPKTRALYANVLQKAATILWNGPMGVFETPEFSEGTFAVARSVAESQAFSVVGGGDSVSALKKSGMAERVSHISTGGGASLEFLQGDSLPGLEVLRLK